MAIIGSFSTVRAQVAAMPALASVMDYVAAALTPGSPENVRILAVPTGETQRLELAGGAFALEQAYRTKPAGEGFFESHRRHIDVQVIVSGAERMELADIARLVVEVPFQPERDLVKYVTAPVTSVLRCGAGDVAVFFPEDGHMPSLADGAPALVHKTVVKVPVA